MIFLFQSSYITFMPMPNSMLLCRSAWLWPLCSLVGRFPVFCYPSSSTKRNSACASTITFLNPVVPFESTIPTYTWYLLAMSFVYHLKTLFKSFLFVTAQAHGAVRRNQYLSCQKCLTEVLTSQEKLHFPHTWWWNEMGQMLLMIDGTKQTPSILEAKIKGTMDHQMIDGDRNKSVSKKI